MLSRDEINDCPSDALIRIVIRIDCEAGTDNDKLESEGGNNDNPANEDSVENGITLTQNRANEDGATTEKLRVTICKDDSTENNDSKEVEEIVLRCETAGELDTTEKEADNATWLFLWDTSNETGNDGNLLENDSETIATGISVGTTVGFLVGRVVGTVVGVVGLVDGLTVGTVEGLVDGSVVGPLDGLIDGEGVGIVDGLVDTVLLGSVDGMLLGLVEGEVFRTVVGLTDGIVLGPIVGIVVGEFVDGSGVGLTMVDLWVGTRTDTPSRDTPIAPLRARDRDNDNDTDVDSVDDCDRGNEKEADVEDDKLDDNDENDDDNFELKDIEVEANAENDVEAVNTTRLIENRWISLEMLECVNNEPRDKGVLTVGWDVGRPEGCPEGGLLG